MEQLSFSDADNCLFLADSRPSQSRLRVGHCFPNSPTCQVSIWTIVNRFALETLDLVAFENFYRRVIFPSAFIHGFRDLLDVDCTEFFPGP